MMMVIIAAEVLVGGVVLHHLFLKPLENKQLELNKIKKNIEAENLKIDSAIFQYNKEDGFQKIRLNENESIEYYDIKTKPIFLNNTVLYETSAAASEQNQNGETKTVVSLESYYNTEIAPNLYREVEYMIKKSGNAEFKYAVEQLMQDGKLTYGEYQSLSIPMALIHKEIEISGVKEDLIKTLK